jgi:hypothetical protein
VLDKSTVPQIPQNKGQNEDVQKENEQVVHELLRVLGRQDLFHFYNI